MALRTTHPMGKRPNAAPYAMEEAGIASAA
jgi:hypothetical protein